MTDQDNGDCSNEDQTVITPDPISGAESHPGKRVIRDEGVEAIDNVDVRNAIYISYLDSLRRRIEDLNVEIQSQIDDDDTHPLLPFNEVGVAVLEMHTLAISYFEGVAFQFCRWGLEMDNEMGDIVIERCLKSSNKVEITEEDTLRERNQKILDWIKEIAVARQYYKILKDADLVDGISDYFHSVVDRRGTYVHHPEALIEFSTTSDIVTVLHECVKLVEGLDEIIEKYLPVDEAMYDVFMSGEER